MLGRECFPCSLASPKEVRMPSLQIAPLPSSSSQLESAGRKGKQWYPWQEEPDLEVGHSGGCTHDKKGLKYPCCFLQLAPTCPKDSSLAEQRVLCSAIGSMLVVGNFSPSS